MNHKLIPATVRSMAEAEARAVDVTPTVVSQPARISESVQLTSLALSPPTGQPSEMTPWQEQAGDQVLQREEAAPNRTGLPDQLKSGVESLSGMSLDHVKVHYNSSQPAQLNASAYAQGSDIHVAPGQEQHLPHEAWHVVQQAQGRVKPTKQMKGKAAINDDAGLEREADVMGAKAMAGPVPAATRQLHATTPQLTDTASANQLKKKKGPPLPGRSKRRRQAQNEELAAMDAENAAWERRREAEEEAEDDTDDEVEQVESPVVAKAPAPTIEALQAANGSVEKLRTLLAGYGEVQGSCMSRLFRSNRKFSTLGALENAAREKMAEDGASAERSPGIGTSSMNGSGTVSGLKKGRGDGYLAGEGGTWHVHYDHVKYGSNGATRVNFAGRTRATILRDLTARSAGIPATGLAACRAWINANLA